MLAARRNGVSRSTVVHALLLSRDGTGSKWPPVHVLTFKVDFAGNVQVIFAGSGLLLPLNVMFNV